MTPKSFAKLTAEEHAVVFVETAERVLHAWENIEDAVKAHPDCDEIMRGLRGALAKSQKYLTYSGLAAGATETAASMVEAAKTEE
jgi:hypothetical protein